MSENFALPHSIVDLEAVAAGRTLAFSLEVGIFSAILERDSAIVINALKDSSTWVASFVFCFFFFFGRRSFFWSFDSGYLPLCRAFSLY